MKKLLLILLLAPQLVFGANPSFQSFDVTDFGTNSTSIWVKSNKWATLRAVTNALDGKVNQTGVGTNLALDVQSVVVTNTVSSFATVVVVGSSTPGVNGTYSLMVSNNSGGNVRMLWTNGASSKIIDYRAPEANDFDAHYSLVSSTNDWQSNFLYAIGAEGSYPEGLWDANLGVGAVTSTAQALVPPLQAGSFKNMFLRLYPTPNTNIVVDPWLGQGIYARRTNGLPFSTLADACAEAQAGDIINMVTAVYPDQGACNPRKGVTINGNWSTISGVLSIVDNNKIRNLITSVQPQATITNADSVTIVENLRVVNSTDYLIVNDVNGLFQLINPINVGYWDGIILHKMRTTGIFQVINPDFQQVWGANTPVTWGMHGIGWQIRAGEGGKLQIFGGSITVLNSTNLTFNTSEGLAGNSCILITDAGGGTTNFGNASLEIYGTSLIHGSTNASVFVSGLSNVLGIPIVGTYKDAIGGAGLFSPVTSESTVIKGNTGVAGRLTNSALTASKLVGSDPGKALTSINVGTGLDLTAGTLTATGGGSQTPWAQDIDGAGFSLSGVGMISGDSVNMVGSGMFGDGITVNGGDVTIGPLAGGGTQFLTVNNAGVVSATASSNPIKRWVGSMTQTSGDPVVNVLYNTTGLTIAWTTTAGVIKGTATGGFPTNKVVEASGFINFANSTAWKLKRNNNDNEVLLENYTLLLAPTDGVMFNTVISFEILP